MTQAPRKRRYSFQGLRTAVLSSVALTAIAFGGTAAMAQNPTTTAGTGGETSPTASPGAGSGQDYSQLDEQGRCDLITGQLQKHVFLAGEAVEGILMDDQQKVSAAAAALDQHTNTLADLIAAHWDGADREQFSQLWNEHLTYYAQYAQAQAGAASGSGGQDQTPTPGADQTATPTGDQTQTPGAGGGEDARRSLNEWASQAADYFSGANPDLDRTMIEEHLRMHGENTLAFIDAAAGESPNAMQLASQEADHMTAFGAWLCGAGEQIFDAVEGDGPGGGASETPTPSTGGGDASPTPSGDDSGDE